jgi:cytochrome P450
VPLNAEAQVLDMCDFARHPNSLSRDVFREVLRLYPPVPMMVRETTDMTFRGGCPGW